jgi:hypothetical protein
MERAYDVAVWLCPPGGESFADYVELVQAAFPLDAVAILMRKYQLVAVVYAAVGLGEGRGIVRFRQGVKIILPEKAPDLVMASH